MGCLRWGGLPALSQFLGRLLWGCPKAGMRRAVGALGQNIRLGPATCDTHSSQRHFVEMD